MELLPLSIGLGLVISLLFSEIFGVAAGGMVVPGYFALFLTKPVPVLVTLAAGFATFAIVHALSSFTIVYGRRRTVLMILVGYLMGALARVVLTNSAMPFIGHEISHEHAIIGYIIPGLIAIWLDRQGIVETFATLITASVVVRLLLVLFVGTELAA
jgi:gamma-polyglutamate biosynthesis protein CapC